MAPTKVDINKRIAQFVALRDLIGEETKAFNEGMKPKKELLEQLSGVLLQHLQNNSVESMASKSGTVYRTVKSSAALADVSAFWNYIETNSDWDMLDKKANVTAVIDYVEKNGVTPPGVNLTQVMTVGVRRK